MATTSTTDDPRRILPHLRLPALGLGAAILAATLGGCHIFENECIEGDERCTGNTLERCRISDADGFTHFETEDSCATAGMTCRDAAGAAACVTDVRCTQSRCDGQSAVICHASGYVQATYDCTAKPDMACVVAPTKTGCAYLAAPCPSGVSSFCDADGHTVWNGCGNGYGYANSKIDCGGSGEVCGSGNGVAECILAGRIACTPTDVFGANSYSCSPDMTALYRCGQVGFVDGSTPCAAGTICVTTRMSGYTVESCAKP